MHVVIVGCGEVGRAIAMHMVQEGCQVVVVDENPDALIKLSNSLDVQTVLGRGSRPSIQEEAGMRHAEMLIAVTPDDEINLMACQVAYTLYQTPKKIARVRAPSYLNLMEQNIMHPQSMAVDMIISPEREVAMSIERSLAVPGSFDTYGFVDDAVQLVGVRVGESSPLIGEPLERWRFLKVPFQPVVFYRGERILHPTESDRLEQGDEVYFVARQGEVARALELLGKREPVVEHAMVIGGGNVGYNLCSTLENKVNLRVLERDLERVQFLAERLGHTTVLHGEALDSHLQSQENIAAMDAVLCVTSDDAANIIASIMARQAHVPSVLTLVHRSDFIPLAEGVGLERIISPQQITVSRILQHVRRGTIEDIHTLRDGSSEVLEFEVLGGTQVVGQKIARLGLPKGARVIALVRSNGTVILPHETPDEVLHPTNHVLIFAENEVVGAVERLFGAR